MRESRLVYTIDMRFLVFSLLLIFLVVPLRAEESVVGPVEHIKDADTILVNRIEVRLYGIDAPESNQSCKNKRGRSYACGKAATKVLTKLLRNKQVKCAIKGKDKYQRVLGICRRGAINVNQYLVAQGWAIAYLRYDDRYIDAQTMAKRQRVGLWQGEFQSPENFRREILANNDESLPSSEKTGCTIKGNINSKGQRIYHTPWGSKNYKKTRISEKKGERWFCTEGEARAAGWRAPKGSK